MKEYKSRSNIYVYWIVIFIALFILGIYFQANHLQAIHLNTIGTPQTQTLNISELKRVGNANFFNEKDGNYYADAKYKIKANDNTAYVRSLFDSGKSVKLPAGNFLCKSKIILNGSKLSVSGVKGKTKIVFDSKNYNNYGKGPYIEGFIVNGNCVDKYKADSAQSINISNIDFEYNRYSNSSPKTIMLFKNIRSANIKNCSFIADLGNGIPVTNLDFYNGCKNVTVSNCFFSNKTKALSGGCIWVRNLTTLSKDIVGNTTENITINKCSFYKDSKDEVIAVYSVIGNVKDVVISNCNIKDYSDKQEVVLSVYSSEDKYYGTVDKVTIKDNNIYSQKFNAYVILIGLENQAKPTLNVVIDNNRIVADSQNNRQKTVIYNSKSNKGSNILINNNEIITKACPYYTAIANACYVDGNKIKGQINTGILGGKVKNNIISGAKNGIVSAEAVLNNHISQVQYGVRIYKGDCNISGNVIELNKDIAFCGLEILSQDNVYCSNNKVRTYGKDQYGIIVQGTNTILLDNLVIGEGQNSIKK